MYHNKDQISIIHIALFKIKNQVQTLRTNKVNMSLLHTLLRQ